MDTLAEEMAKRTVGAPVRFQGERFRITKVINGGRDIVIINVEGYKMTVSPLTVEIGWGHDAV